jgi:two-component system, sensor histidine kinase YesM
VKEVNSGTRHPRGIESRLILYSLGLALLFLACLVGVSFFTLRGFLKANLRETTSYRLRIAMEYIDRDVDRLVQVLDWSTVSDDVVDYLSASGADESALKLKALAAYYPLRDAVFSSGLDAYVDKFIVSGGAGRTVQLGLVQGDRGDVEAAFKEAPGLAAGEPSRLEPEPFFFSRGASMIPFARAIEGEAGRGRGLGFSFMAVNPAILVRFLPGFALEKGSRLFITIGGAPYEILPGRVSTKACADFPLRSVVSFRGEKTGWILSQTLPTVQLTRQNTIFALLLALMAGAMALFAVLLLFMVDRTFNHPVALINRRVALVSKGDFSCDPSIEWPNELGDIGRAVNRMSRDIEALIEKRVESENARKDLEFRMLQSQINPHFLYNTLGTIKWMAEIQKAPGIAEVVNSLAALLRHAALGSETFISLERELELVGEYCLIQRYRSANLFKLRVSVADESLMDCLVPKFMLQPLVENAIMHGIAPKLEPGTVTIEAEPAPGGRMRVSVADDGVGVEPGRIRQALEGGPSDKEAFNRIGLRNVDERIRLAFGPDCGLTMESEIGKYTRVSMVIPRRTAGISAEPEEAACTRS